MPWYQTSTGTRACCPSASPRQESPVSAPCAPNVTLEFPEMDGRVPFTRVAGRRRIGFTSFLGWRRGELSLLGSLGQPAHEYGALPMPFVCSACFPTQKQDKQQFRFVFSDLPPDRRRHIRWKLQNVFHPQRACTGL